ncbi:MAG: hypothetical protein LKI28_05750 [Ancrocorticia sp.]|jgi:predicted HTH transcriptional regulator|nr:hypothetical protein [Ancrocorticia sp.]MCI2178176.1 hypothetical protein [Ancrocorticia sp.]
MPEWLNLDAHGYVTAHEGKTLEFKRDLSSPTKLLRTIVAFANMEFLLKHAYKTSEFGEVKRRDVYSIPVEAIREVIVNAIVHANYGERGTPIRVGFYDDRIQVDRQESNK